MLVTIWDKMVTFLPRRYFFDVLSVSCARLLVSFSFFFRVLYGLVWSSVTSATPLSCKILTAQIKLVPNTGRMRLCPRQQYSIVWYREI